MARTLEDQVRLAFAQEPELAQQILGALAETPTYRDLFGSIARYVQVHSNSSSDALDERPGKRVRHPPLHVPVPGDANGIDEESASLLLSVGELSFTSPQRRKLLLELTTLGLRGTISGTGAIVFTVRWEDIRQIVCVPVPEKPQRQFYFCIFPKHGDGVTTSAADPAATDAIVWTVPDAIVETASGESVTAQPGTYKSMLTAVLNKQTSEGIELVEANERDFASTIVQSHRRGEKAVHVKAFRGIKDGYLYFLPTGIMWAYKKPLLFFSFSAITSVSYTSVLQRTFNLNIITSSPVDPTSVDTSYGAPEEEITTEYEFSMIDQEDYAVIDAYIKRHALHDASMAETRRADAARPDPGGRDHVKAEEADAPQLEAPVEDDDDEDEDDEGGDYDPGSEGESEGSGGSTSNDDETGETLAYRDYQGVGGQTDVVGGDDEVEEVEEQDMEREIKDLQQ